MKYIPLRKQGSTKAPRDTDWTNREYSAKEIKAWRESGGNLGLRLGPKDLVLDIDPRNNPEGLDADQILAKLDEELDIDLMSYPRSRTGSDGIHVIMTKPEDMRVRKYPFGKERRDLEFKVVGSQIVAPGSIHPETGRKYVVEKKGKARLAPDALLDKIKKILKESKNAAPTNIELSQIVNCLALLDPQDFRDQEDWLKLGMSVHAASGGSSEARAEWTKWCWSDPNYEGDESVGERWDSYTAGGDISASTLFYFTHKAAGGVPPADPEDDFEDLGPEPESDGYTPRWRLTRGKAPTINSQLVHNSVEAVRVMGPDIGWNEHSKSLVWKTSLMQLEDQDVRAMIMAVSDTWGLKWSGDPSEKSMNAAIERYGRDNAFHPVKEYLESLEWDKDDRISTWLSEYTQAPATKYVHAVGRLLLVAAVARIYRPGVKYDNVVVFEGRQGSGKSSLVRVLGGKWSIEGLPVLGLQSEADIVDRIRDKWVIEIDEMLATKKSDVDHVKAFVSRTSDNVRLAYDRRKMHFPRQCVFIGTTNDDSYLRDMTGNRRWLPVKVEECDFLRVEVDRDQIWAEAVQVYKADPMQILALPDALSEDAMREQEERMMEDAFEEPIRNYVAKIGSRDPIANETIITEAITRTYTSMKQPELVRVGQIMRRIGWEKYRMRCQDSGARRQGWKKKKKSK
ncbi:hypothetical protein LCGC14_0651500 [marine sediment metagenome]|uniref:DNA primase/polymerase bifunctional N-terminal domain-containing protein n=1 Tax=marine sediment metagenome TaxID=412755 RepID=A0A0F9U4J5_9ZZZZ